MSNLEHLVENGLCAAEKCLGYNDWYISMKDDINWTHISWLSVEDLWTICQYVIYTWCTINREECKAYNCADDKVIHNLKIDKSNLIYRSTVVNILRERAKFCEGIYGDLGGACSGAAKLIEKLPSAEDEEIVRCGRRSDKNY